jgi:hypothetical protein
MTTRQGDRAMAVLSMGGRVNDAPDMSTVCGGVFVDPVAFNSKVKGAFLGIVPRPAADQNS